MKPKYLPIVCVCGKGNRWNMPVGCPCCHSEFKEDLYLQCIDCGSKVKMTPEMWKELVEMMA